MPVQDAIEYFGGPFRFLSNFYAADVEFEGVVYPTAEHAFQAAKTLDPTEKRTIRNAANPKEAKAFGRGVELRDDWEDVKLGVMEEIVLSKFRRHPDLAEKLLATGDADLVEGNSWGDRFWGRTADGEGANHLGRILVRVRDYLRSA